MNPLLCFLAARPAPRSFSLFVLGACLSVLLTACGGGGGGATSATPSAAVLAPSASLANLCAMPRPNTVDRQGTLAQEKAYLRSFINETYLWYRDVPVLDPSTYASAQDYFDALKTPLLTPSQLAVDQFHFWESTDTWNAASSGQATGYGIRWLYVSDNLPRAWVVAKVAPGSAAALAGVKRGDTLTTLDGLDFLYENSPAGVQKLDAALSASAGEAHLFGFNYAAPLSLSRSQYPVTTVQNVHTIQNGAATVGYFLFDTHIAHSEAELVAAITQLQSAQVSELVIDMRYNGGGLLSIASELAYMVAGPNATRGKTFERLLYNDKRSAENYSVPFYSQGYNGQALPHLDLPRVTLLVTRATASASESVINSLRGVGVTVDLVGSTTRGKPYGFVPQDNCGTTYFAIQFKGVNDQGFGDYTDGFAPTCYATDDYTHPLGDSSEATLGTALQYLVNGACPPVALAASGPRAQALAGAAGAGAASALRHPASPELRILTQPARP